MVPQLLYFPSACSIAPHIALEESGASYEAVLVDLAGGEQRTETYLALNPKGRVPVLITDAGILTENPAILAYIAQAYPEARLAPLDDPFAFAQAQSFNAYLASTVHVALANFHRAARWTDDAAAQASIKGDAPGRLATAFQLIEDRLLAGPYVLGDRFGICDAYLYFFTGWLLQSGADGDRFPKVIAHHARMTERPAVQRVLAREGGPA